MADADAGRSAARELSDGGTVMASTQVKAKVFKQRIRLKDFFIDFDKLRSGYITQAQVTCARMPQGPCTWVTVQPALLRSFLYPADGPSGTANIHPHLRQRRT